MVFPGLVAEQVRAGASILVTITNDAWYGDTAAPWQHFRAARFRAAENRRPMVRAAITGVSGLIDARGRVHARLGVGEEGVIGGEIRGNRSVTPFSRAPCWCRALSGDRRICYHPPPKASGSAGELTDPESGFPERRAATRPEE